MPDRSELVQICHRLYNKGLVAALDGNISAKINESSYYITRSVICKGDITENDILVIDNKGSIIEGEGKVSTEFKIHLNCYKQREDVNAVIHCHPVYVSGFAAAGKTFPLNIFPEVILTLGNVPLCEYATPSTNQLPQSMDPYLKSGWAYILQNHGAVTLGKDLKDAYFHMEKLEHTAKTLVIAELLGGARPLPEKKLNELISIAYNTYGINLK